MTNCGAHSTISEKSILNCRHWQCCLLTLLMPFPAFVEVESTHNLLCQLCWSRTVQRGLVHPTVIDRLILVWPIDAFVYGEFNSTIIHCCIPLF